MVSRNAYNFFRQHAGGVVGRNAEGALHLARAEEYAQDNGWSVSWEGDDYQDWSDHESWCPGYANEKRLGKWQAMELRAPRCPGHEFACALLRDADGEVLASLGGIIDASNAYARVVEAELASEALAEIQARADNDRKAASWMAL